MTLEIFEIYRKFEGGSLTQSTGSVPKVERTTVHISDDTGRIAMLEKRTFGSAVDDNGTVESLERYVYSNHLQSASLELDEDGAIISYEEYHPYGTTSYQEAMNASINATAKRYRYTGKERDEESGLYYHGARYYISWLARWTAVDPLESKYAGMSSYNYCINNPIIYTDSDGKDITITGVLSDEALKQLQGAAGKSITLTMTNGRVDYIVDTDKRLRGAAKKIARIIDNESIKINLTTTDLYETYKKDYFIGGAFMGNIISADIDGKTIVNAFQEINPNFLGRADEHTKTPGKMIMHEVTEAYEGAKISMRIGISALPAKKEDIYNFDSLYYKAHQRATPQSTVYSLYYDEKNNQIYDDNEIRERAVRVDFEVENKKGERKIIHTILNE